jgi:hypothetical protein
VGARAIPSPEDQIAQIQKLLATNPPAWEAVVLTRQLGQLTGALKTYQRKSEPEQPQEPESLPKWWNDSWARIFISERARGIVGGWGVGIANWIGLKPIGPSKRDCLLELREALRREDAEWKAQHLPEQLAMVRADLYERYPDQYLGKGLAISKAECSVLPCNCGLPRPLSRPKCRVAIHPS